MQRRSACAFDLGGLLRIFLVFDELNQRLLHIFQSEALSATRFGPGRWIRGGAAFTTLEPSAAER